MYSIDTDQHRRIVFVTLTGLFSLDEVKAFADAMQAAIRSHRWKSGQYVVLVDAPSNVIQQQEVVAAFQNVIGDAPIKARRIAAVTRGVLYKMQTRRILLSERSALFESMAEAEQWVLAEADPV